MADTTVRADLLQAFHVLTELVVEDIRHGLRPLAVLGVLLPVKEPPRDLELLRVLDHSHEALNLVLSELSSSLGQVNFRHLAAQV